MSRMPVLTEPYGDLFHLENSKFHIQYKYEMSQTTALHGGLQ